MKKALLPFLFFLLVSIVAGQTVNYANHRGVETLYASAGINAKFFYLEESWMIPYCCSRPIFLVGKDGEGKEFLRKWMFTLPYPENITISRTSDEQLLVRGGTLYKGCDLDGILYHAMKVDTSGSITWSYQSTEVIKNIMPWSDGGFFIHTNQTFTRHNAAGATIGNFTLSIANIQSLIPHSSGNILMSYLAQSGPRLRLIDLAGTTLSDKLSDSPFTKMLEGSSGSIYGLGGGILYKCSPTFSFLINTTNILTSVSYITDFNYRHDSIFITGMNKSGKPLYMIIDSNFTVKYTSTSNLEFFTPVGLYLGKNNLINIVGTGSANFNPSNTFTGYLQTPMQGNLNCTKDIGVKRVANLNLWSVPNINNSDLFVYANADVIVHNYGTDTIGSFHLSQYAIAASFNTCLIGLNKLFLQKIPPGDSTKVSTGAFFFQRLYWAPGFPPPLYDLCIGTSVPDSTIDMERSNDYFCLQSLMLPVDVKENEEFYQFAKVFPNPSQYKTTVTSNVIVNSYEIRDITGHLIENSEVNSDEFIISHEDFPAGVYSLKIISDHAVITKKLIINR